MGFSKALFGAVRLDASWFDRAMSHFADDDLLLNTGVGFPIAFRRAEIRGTEVKLDGDEYLVIREGDLLAIVTNGKE